MPTPPETAPSVRLRQIGDRPPTAVEASWRDPEDNSPQHRAPRRITGTRAFDPIQAIVNRPGSVLTDRHLKASYRYLSDYEIGIFGAHPNAPDASGVRGSGGVLYPAERQSAAIRSIRLAQIAVGTWGVAVLNQIVIGIPDPTRRDVASYAKRLGINAQVAMGLLAGALDRLADHYGLKTD